MTDALTMDNMDQQTEIAAPYFDSAALRAELTELAHEHSKSDTKLRAVVLARLKELVEFAREQAELGLVDDGRGRRCAEGLSLFQDELIRVIYDFTVHHAYRAKNPSSAERMALVATGGYGRSLLAPGSDIDLLFLLPYKQTAWGESVVEYMLYMLWDLGFKVGHATRSTEQCVRLSHEDMTIRTALLDARLIWGDEGLFEELETRFQKDVVTGSGQAFVEAKFAERNQRHEQTGKSRYLVEPNIKDGKGGLRDLHTLHWLAAYLTDFGKEKDLIEAGIFSTAEYHSFRKAEDFLWTIRCHLHFLTKRPEERLTFDVQTAMAQRLGYTAHGGLQAVERFMRHYFLVAKDVGDLTRIVCTALEMKELKSTPKLNKLLDTLPWRKGPKLKESDSFKIENGRINITHRDVFKNDPVNLIRLFALAEEHNVLFHPDAMRLVRGSARLIDKDLRANKEANEIFLGLLMAKTGSENALRKMNEAGVLGRFIPDFGRIVSMMQFNMYHHFTVDEHLIQSVGVLNDIENGDHSDEHPLCSQVIHTIKNRRALFVAMLLHDIAKGRPEDHSIAGAVVAREVCPGLGLSAAETETVAWLVENHLVMSEVAQSRDINDPKTIQDFAAVVQSPERLNLLLILTVADIRAVGPGVWNGWKGQLLRALYYETEPRVSGGHSKLTQEGRIFAAKDKLCEALSDWDRAKLDKFKERHFQTYWLRTDTDRQVAHATLIAQAEAEGKTLATSVTTDAFKAVTELTVFAKSHPRLLAMVTGSCVAAGANIVDAQITTTRDGMALDTICLQREFEREEDEQRRAGRIVESIGKLIGREITLKSITTKRREQSGRVRAFSHAPEVLIDNTLSDELTVIEVRGMDRPGLLFDLTRTIGDLDLDIASAHIATFGEKVVDVLYVTDLDGNKITEDGRLEKTRDQLLAIFDGE